MRIQNNLQMHTYMYRDPITPFLTFVVAKVNLSIQILHRT
jgi:hypothetical protein